MAQRVVHTESNAIQNQEIHLQQKINLFFFSQNTFPQIKCNGFIIQHAFQNKQRSFFSGHCFKESCPVGITSESILSFLPWSFFFNARNSQKMHCTRSGLGMWQDFNITFTKILPNRISNMRDIMSNFLPVYQTLLMWFVKKFSKLKHNIQ